MNTMDVDPIRTILVISNQMNGKELFRVLVHELSIRFDEKLQKGIEKNPELKIEIDSLNYMWKNKKVEQSQIFPIMLDIMTRHGEYMMQFFFDDSELDSTGQFNEKPNREKDPKSFFFSLKKQRILQKITKKHFQEQIKSNLVAEQYVEMFQTKSSYYFYRMFKSKPLVEEWYFMEKNERLLLCFVNRNV